MLTTSFALLLIQPMIFASYAKKNFGMFGGEEVNVNVAISSQFFGWVFALGTGVKILAPENVVERMKQEIDALHDFYNK